MIISLRLPSNFTFFPFIYNKELFYQHCVPEPRPRLVQNHRNINKGTTFSCLYPENFACQCEMSFRILAKQAAGSPVINGMSLRMYSREHYISIGEPNVVMIDKTSDEIYSLVIGPLKTSLALSPGNHICRVRHSHTTRELLWSVPRMPSVRQNMQMWPHECCRIVATSRR